ncbi:MAG: hypothetical protein PHH77_07595 [Victivallaceae bacterium]|nr:hypothetical protein [Victivallaceae bacterium]
MLDPEDNPNAVTELINNKHRHYNRAAQVYRFLYYATRLAAGLCAGILPFVVKDRPPVATGLSLAIVVITVLDVVLNPKDKWALYSKATDFLTVTRLKISGDYAKYKEVIDILFETESKALAQLVSINKVMDEVQQARQGN